MDGIRIAKYFVQHNLCSRREAERWVAAGRVQVNGARVLTPAFFVQETDVVTLDDEPIARAQHVRLWAYYKPVRQITTHRDPQGRPTVFAAVRALGLPHVVSVGRLDFNSEGLLLLTNTAALAHRFERPDSALERIYRVRVFGAVRATQLARWAVPLPGDILRLQGVCIEGTRYAPAEVESKELVQALHSAPAKPHNFWCTLHLHEGKNREIRKIMAALGLQVNRLIRTQYGPFSLGNLRPGQLQELSFSGV